MEGISFIPIDFVAIILRLSMVEHINIMEYFVPDVKVMLDKQIFGVLQIKHNCSGKPECDGFE